MSTQSLSLSLIKLDMPVFSHVGIVACIYLLHIKTVQHEEDSKEGRARRPISAFLNKVSSN